MKTLIGAEHLDKLASKKLVAFDCETLQLRPEMEKLRLLQFATWDYCVVVDLFSCTEKLYKLLDEFFAQERTWLAHNAVFDLSWLQCYGWEPAGQVNCTMLMHRLVTNGKKSKFGNKLKELCHVWLKQDLDKTEQTSDWSGELTQSQLEYAAKDAAVLLELDRKLFPLIQRKGLEDALEVECEALPALAQMQRIGVPWSREGLQKARKHYQFDIEKAKVDFLMQLDEALPDGHKLLRNEDGTFNLRAKKSGTKSDNPKMIERYGKYKEAGLNLGSPKQMLEKFEAVIGEKPYDEKNERHSTSKAALAPYQEEFPCVETYLNWKHLVKREQMVASMIEKQGDDGFIRAGYMQVGAETLRMTSNTPNMQQIPRDEDFRACAAAPEGWVFLDADYSQAELRLAAWIAKDEKMMQAYIDGQDLHQLTADAIGCSRQVAKSANFGLLYGSGANGLKNYANGMGVSLSLEEARKIRKNWLDLYSGISEWHEKLSAEANEETDTLAAVRIPVTNAIRHLPDDKNQLTVRANTPVQGAGAAMLKVALANLWPGLQKHSGDVSLAACIHDELLLLCKEELVPKFQVMLQQVMEDAGQRFMGKVPCVAEVKIGRTWAEAH